MIGNRASLAARYRAFKPPHQDDAVCSATRTRMPPEEFDTNQCNILLRAQRCRSPVAQQLATDTANAKAQGLVVGYTFGETILPSWS